MPLVGKKQVSPDEAFKQGLCPECGHDLTDVDPETHILEHWPYFGSPMFMNDEAHRRGQMIRDFGQRQRDEAKAAAAKQANDRKPADQP